jgi:hypothetical protein
MSDDPIPVAAVLLKRFFSEVDCVKPAQSLGHQLGHVAFLQ